MARTRIKTKELMTRRRAIAALMKRGFTRLEICAELGIGKKCVDRECRAINGGFLERIEGLLTQRDIHDQVGFSLKYTWELLKEFGIKPVTSYAGTKLYSPDTPAILRQKHAEKFRPKDETEQAAELPHYSPLTDVETLTLETLAERVAEGVKITPAAAEIGIDKGKLNYLLLRARRCRYSFPAAVARYFVDRVETCRNTGKPFPPAPGHDYQIAIRLEAHRRGIGQHLLFDYVFKGWDLATATQSKNYWKQHLHAGDYSRFKQLADLRLAAYREAN